MFGKKAPPEPPSEEKLRKLIENAIDEGAGFIILRKGLITSGSDVKVVDRVIAEVLHARSDSTDMGSDPFLKNGHSITHTSINSEEEHAPYTEKHQEMADAIGSQQGKLAPSKLVANSIFLLTLLAATVGSVYALIHFMPQRDQGCEDGGPTSLLCAELLLDRYFQAQGEYPDRLELLVPRYAVLPLSAEETNLPYFYEVSLDGSGYRLCPSEAANDEFCSIRSVRAPTPAAASAVPHE